MGPGYVHIGAVRPVMGLGRLMPGFWYWAPGLRVPYSLQDNYAEYDVRCQKILEEFTPGTPWGETGPPEFMGEQVFWDPIFL